MKSLTFISFLVLFSFSLVAQEGADCINPLVLCGDSPFQLDQSLEVGESDDLGSACLAMEFSPTWIVLNITGSGDLIFDIIPSEDYFDIDFGVFKIVGTDCDTKELIRCMASGATAGMNSDICLGPTGLAFGETDVEETAGCSNGSNNYLAPLVVEAGEKYMLYIDDFGGSDTNLQLDFGGTAEIECISSSINEVNGNEKPMKVFPNRSSGIFNIDFSVFADDATISVYDAVGKLVLHKPVYENLPHSINLKNHPEGLYFLVYEYDKKLASERLMLIK